MPGTDTRLGAADPEGGCILVLDNDGNLFVRELGSPDAKPRPLGDRPHGRGILCADWYAPTDVIATGRPGRPVATRGTQLRLFDVELSSIH